MSEKFHAELDELKKDVLTMGRLANDMLWKSIEALKDRDTRKAEWVVSKRKELSELDDRIEESSLRLIALYQPMAEDMRTIATSLKMNTYLARVGRYGKDIAKVAIELADQPSMAKLVSIPFQAKTVCGMVDDALTAFETGDLAKITDMAERDSTVDALRYSIFRECLSYMMEDPKNITRCSHYTMIARYLERCGDHACKMAEKIHYMVTGERIEIK
ncbi:MAG: phosphate signaling complex protein PhoU [Methanobacteriota archaeon]